jgi:hypothetical protein
MSTLGWPQTSIASCDLPNMFQPLQFRRGTVTTPRKLLLRYVTGNHFVPLKANPSNALVRPGQAANEHHYFNGTRDVRTGLCASCLQLCHTFVQNNTHKSIHRECRPLQSMEARESDFDAAVQQMLSGDHGKAAIVSLTFGRQGKHLRPTAVSGFTGLLKK